MPFDGTDFRVPTALDTGLFPIWSEHGLRHWLRTRFRPQNREKAVVMFHASPPERASAIVRLLQDAKGLIEDPEDWTRGTYRSLRGRRCAVGALRAAARHLNDPSPAWSAHELLIRVARSRGFTSVEAMNDRSSHAGVLAAFDEAIVLAHSAAGARF
jgi:hypothetical protein